MTPKDFLFAGMTLATMSGIMLASFLRLTGLIYIAAIAVFLFTIYRILHAMSVTGGQMEPKDWLIAVAPAIALGFLILVFALWGI